MTSQEDEIMTGVNTQVEEKPITLDDLLEDDINKPSVGKKDLEPKKPQEIDNTYNSKI